MVFNDTSTKSGLIQDCEELCFGAEFGAISSSTNRLYQFTNKLNRALEKVTGKIREAEGRWQWDDSNKTDFAIATATLTTNQQDYSLDATSHFRIERVEIKDTSGGWTKLTPIDQADIYDQSLTDYLNTSGIPAYYDKVGNSLFLYPKPNYTQAASLKLFFERGPDYFVYTDTSKAPGFNPLYHRLLSLYASFEYAPTDALVTSITAMETDLTEYYARRDKDEHTRLKARIFNFR